MQVLRASVRNRAKQTALYLSQLACKQIIQSHGGNTYGDKVFAFVIESVQIWFEVCSFTVQIADPEEVYVYNTGNFVGGQCCCTCSYVQDALPSSICRPGTKAG